MAKAMAVRQSQTAGLEASEQQATLPLYETTPPRTIAPGESRRNQSSPTALQDGSGEGPRESASAPVPVPVPVPVPAPVSVSALLSHQEPDPQAADVDYWVPIVQNSGEHDRGSSNQYSQVPPAGDDFDFGVEDTGEGFANPAGDVQTLPTFNVRTPSAQAAGTDGASSSSLLQLGMPYPSYQQHSLNEPPASRDESNRLLTSRLGKLTLTGDGKLRYYGATSNLHLIQNQSLSLFQPNIRTVRTHGDAALSRAGLQWTVDVDYERYLTRLFFLWQNPSNNEVTEKVYLSEKESYDSGDDTWLYSPTLQNAILSVGACFSSRPAPGIQGVASEFFASRAMTLIEIEMDSPTLATLQALSVLSAHEAASGRDSRGWLYSGMGVHLIMDLGLHLDLEVDHKLHFMESSVQAVQTIYRQIFWSTYSVNILWSSYAGRPSVMNKLGKIIREPAIIDMPRWDCREVVPDFPELPPEIDHIVAGSVPIYSYRLIAIMGKIGDILYNEHPDRLPSLDSFLQGMTSDLQQWRESLPPTMQVDGCETQDELQPRIYLPSVLQLHMQYYHVLVLLHRPFISGTRSFDPADHGEICRNSASAICSLLVKFRRQCSLRYVHLTIVHIVVTAGLIHAYDSCMLSGPNQKQSQDHLLTCVHGLSEMSQTYKSATRGMELVTTFRRDLESRKPSRKDPKRPWATEYPF
ncbi:hypothetical protein A1O3_06856 [Capronia epimyces CBS 606.96]|uniref:Xylanolytic transcriptional activator regulatory domain-containing protein n=1 Tax=Capronia epimyces CBS 606.96 TaxID=1182542 RepID=W9YL93_9EURO|nr:uncharacterized protein A1O3_06856 [Capronia epimyces CBS 606.96]EXJ83039.1 hypothetical protein A1O3_06856 [Capronia epimyces CBS 606.96]